jgi:ABC-type multidrug transport system fused ATPase/permease subunit
MRDLARDKTVLTIAHRLHTIRSADQIIVLDKGHLQACAPHKQLEKDSALYRALLAHDVVEDTL